MNRCRFYALLIIVLIFTFVTCTTQDAIQKYCTTNETAFVKSRSAFPSKMQLGESINVDVSFDIRNSCGAFDSFYIVKESNTYFIEVITKYNACAICIGAIETKKATYQFKPKKEGIYSLKLKSGDNKFISSSIEVL